MRFQMCQMVKEVEVAAIVDGLLVEVMEILQVEASVVEYYS